MNASAFPRPEDAYDADLDESFDLDMSYARPEGRASAPAPAHEPLQFTAPIGSEPTPFPAAPVPAESFDQGEPFNPVGELVAGASAALAPIESGLPEIASSPGYGQPDPSGVSIPRIAIHVFAERQDTLAAADRAGKDRRMARATTHIRVGGIPAAIDTYAHEPTPPLIIVECLKDPHGLLAEIDALAEVCDAGTKVVVIGATNDILLFRELMRRGVSEYLVAPLQPLQLIAAIGGLSARAAVRERPQSRTTPHMR